MMPSNPIKLTIAYRIYPGVSKTPFIHSDNKLKLTELGIRTLKQSLSNYRVKVIFLLDNCPPGYSEMILNFYSEEDISIINYNGIGNLATFGKQIDALLQQNDSELVMFAEDDYVYRKDELAKAIRLLEVNPAADFVTPYDHLDSYTLPIHTSKRYEIIAEEGLHWRTSASTCLTFITKKSTLKACQHVFRSYCAGNWDSSLWFALTKYNVLDVRSLLLVFNDLFLFKAVVKSWIKCGWQIGFGKKYKLWQPMPSIATHMEKTGLAPVNNWEQIVQDSYSNPV